jgi:hypothetical protein
LNRRCARSSADPGVAPGRDMPIKRLKRRAAWLIPAAAIRSLGRADALTAILAVSDSRRASDLS